MQTLEEVVRWHTQHQDYINFFKDVIFAIAIVATFYGYFKFLKFLTRRKVLNKRQEMENDAKLFNEIHKKLKEYVDSYEASQNELRDIGVRLLFIKNYPYKLDADGFRQELYYYFMSEHHKANGYISGKGLYVMDYLWFLGNSIYYNPKNKKWFIDEKGHSYRKYKELRHKQLVKRIPFANIYGYDFNSDWADKGEPVFYTKYKYYKWKLFADDLDAVSIDQEFHLAHKVPLKKSKRAKRTRAVFRRLKNRIRAYFLNRKTSKLIKQQSKNHKN